MPACLTPRSRRWDRIGDVFRLLTRLLESGEGAAIRSRHQAFILALAEEAEPKLAGLDQAEWLDRLGPRARWRCPRRPGTPERERGDLPATGGLFEATAPAAERASIW